MLTESKKRQKEHHSWNYDQNQSPAIENKWNFSAEKSKQGNKEIENTIKKLCPYTVSNKFLIFSELSDVRLSKLLADELTLVTTSSICPRTLPGRNTWSTPIFLAADKSSEKFLRFCTVIFACPTTYFKVLVVLPWNSPWPLYNTMHPTLDA